MEANKVQEEIQKPVEENCYREEYQSIPIKTIIGIRNEDRSNFQMISTDKLVSYSGISFSVIDLNLKKQTTIYSKDGGGIGAIALDYTKRYLAVAEKGQKPNVYIYDLFDMSVTSVLANGTERGYCSVCFSKNSDKFISIGTSPDYSIVVWDWKSGKTLLKAKAFSQEVYKVSFSDFSDDIICSSGMAHIKFWKIANTFTGLKLKGEIGKFGTTELSDISDFVHLSDGNVISGSETGNLLLWEGNFIKNVISQGEKLPCHKGTINCVKIFEETLLITGSINDNIIKIWPTSEFQNLSNEEGLDVFFIPIKEIILEEGFGVINIDISFIRDGVIFVQEKHGYLLKIKIADKLTYYGCKEVIEFTPIVEKVYEFSSDTISGFQLNQDNLVFAGNDGMIKVLDIKTEDMTFWKVDNHSINSLTLCNTTEVVIIGNSKGLVKSYKMPQMNKVSCYKVFEESVEQIKVENVNVVCMSKKSIFVFNLSNDGSLEPHFLVESSNAEITSSVLLNNMLILGNAIGELRGFRIPEAKFHSNEKNYLLINPPEECYSRLQMMEFQKPKKDEDDIRYYLNDEMEFQDVEWEPQAIRSLTFLWEENQLQNSTSRGKLLVGSEGNFCGYLYILEMRSIENNFEKNSGEVQDGKSACVQEASGKTLAQKVEKESKQQLIRPLQAIQTRGKVVTCISYDFNKGLHCYWGYVDGVISVRLKTDLNRELLRVRAHNHDTGQVQSIFSAGNGNLFSCSKDSTAAIMTLEPFLKQVLEKRPIETELKQKNIPKIKRKILIDTENENLQIETYSLQKDKIQSLKDKMKQQAQAKRDEISQKVFLLRQNFQFIKDQNRKLNREFRIPEVELIFDVQYNQELPEIFDREIEEIEKEIEFDIKVEKMKVDKLNKFFVKENTEFVFEVSKLKNGMAVESFRLKNMTNFMRTGLEQIALLIDSEKMNDGEESTDQNESVVFSNIKNLLATLNDLKKGINENKTRDPYLQFKQKVKEECAEFDTIDKLRDHQKNFNTEASNIKKNDLPNKTVEESKEIKLAKSKFGDYMLKTSENFKIDEKNRVDVQKLETHILLLEKFLFNTKESFNKNLFSMRVQKHKILKQIEEHQKTLIEISDKIGSGESLPETNFQPEKEFPELKFKVTETEINNYQEDGKNIESESKMKTTKNILNNDLEVELYQLKKKTMSRFPDIKMKIHKQDLALEKLGYHISLNQPESDLIDECLDAKSLYFKDIESQQESQIHLTVSTALQDLKKLQNEVRTKRKNNIDNPKIQQIFKMEKIKLQAKRKTLLQKINLEVENFDAEIDKMIIEKRKVESELKMAQMRILELFREWLEIQIFEEEDQIMRKDLAEKKAMIKEWNEKKLMNLFSEKEVVSKLSRFEHELKLLEESYKEKIFPSEPEKAEFVYKYFTINYRKNQMNENATDETEDMNTKEFDPNNLDPDKKECILCFEQNEEWVEILKKRYETDEAMHAVQKTKTNLDSENLKIDEKIKTIQKSLLETKGELDCLQFKKLRRIHKLNCSFILDLDQVFLKSPLSALDDGVVFTNEQLKKLRTRTTELEEECRKIESERSELYVSQDALIRNLNVLRTCKKQAKEELDENFKLKFGEYVNLDILNSLKETKKLKEMKREYKEVDNSSTKRIEDAKNSLAKTQEELVELKRKNTEILKRITLLGNAQIRLNKTLDNTNKQIFKDEKDFKTENSHTNKKDLLGIIKLLNSELDALKTEISALKQK